MLSEYPRKTKQQKIEGIAHHLYKRRGGENQPHNPQQAEQDWVRATKIYRNPVRKTLFWFNQPFIWTEKRVIEPASQHLRNSAIFDIVDRLSPAAEAIGVLLIPGVLYLASQAYEQQREAQEIERLQQEAVSNYLGQLSEIFLNVDGDLRSDENQRISAIATASTITLLRDPNLDGRRKGQVITFLSQMELIQGQHPSETDTEEPFIDLRGANLRDASLSETDLRDAHLSGTDLRGARLWGSDLRDADLSGTDLRDAHLSGTDLWNADLWNADLSGTDLWNADLRDANLRDADLWNADLRDADLRDANLRDAYLWNADLRGADLGGADLRDAYLWNADLRGADLGGADLSRARGLTTEQLSQALLCQARLPEEIALDPDRDCPDDG